MIRSKIKIGSGAVYDTFSQYGLCHLDSDKRVDSPVKEYESTSYVDEPGEHLYPKTVADAFDYETEFLVMAPNSNIGNANKKIRAFNSLLYTEDSNGVRTFKKVEFYNYYTRVKIVGYPYPIDEATDFYRDTKGRVEDAVKVKFKIRCSDPTLCDWAIQLPSNAAD